MNSCQSTLHLWWSLWPNWQIQISPKLLYWWIRILKPRECVTSPSPMTLTSREIRGLAQGHGQQERDWNLSVWWSHRVTCAGYWPGRSSWACVSSCWFSTPFFFIRLCASGLNEPTRLSYSPKSPSMFTQFSTSFCSWMFMGCGNSLPDPVLVGLSWSRGRATMCMLPRGPKREKQVEPKASEGDETRDWRNWSSANLRHLE